jgi:hypothetical protein
MGFSAKPTFSKASAARSPWQQQSSIAAPAPAASSSGRPQPPQSSATPAGVPPASPARAASTPSSLLVREPGSMEDLAGANQQWADDADLDDLLND